MADEVMERVSGDLPFLDHTTPSFAADPHAALRRAREQSWLVRTPTGLGSPPMRRAAPCWSIPASGPACSS